MTLTAAVAAHQAGQLDDALRLYHAHLERDPNSADAHHLVAMLYLAQGKLAEAQSSAERALAIAPTIAAFHNLLAVILEQRADGRAVAHFAEAVALDEKFFEARRNLVDLLRRLGRVVEAQAHLPALLAAADPADPSAFEHALTFEVVAKCEFALGHFAEAATLFARAIALQPTGARLNDLGACYERGGRLDDAHAAYIRALAIEPSLAEAHNNLGDWHRRRQEIVEAERCYREAIRCRPTLAEAHNNLGVLFRQVGRLQDALDCHTSALRLKPTLAEAQCNIGNVQLERGEVAGALASFSAAAAARPDFLAAVSNRLLALNYAAPVDAAGIAAAHREFGDAVAALAQPLSVADPRTDRPLRVGYVSPDFRRHSVAYFLTGLFAHHDRAQVELYAYSDVTRPDDVSARLFAMCKGVHEVAALTDEQLCNAIRADAIDVLVDLTSHTAQNRLAVFARRAAPVQVAYLGYPNTTGLRTMDYRIVDAHTDPLGADDAFYTEQRVRLPGGFLAYTPLANAPDVGDLPSLRNGFITFGSFNNLAKINRPLIALWARLLARVPSARLYIKASGLSDEVARTRLRALLRSENIPSDRVVLHGRIAATAGHLAAYHDIDIALDTFPYHGTTTTCEALLMGVPVLTLAGSVHASRVGVSLLSQLGAAALVARDEDALIETAVALATDPAALVGWRASLRTRLMNSSLVDGARLAKEMEAGYRQMWRDYLLSERRR